MAESELSILWADIKAEVGFYAGWGPESRPWSAAETSRIDTFLRLGYNQALEPPPLPGKDRGHLWSFLEPIDTLTTTEPYDTGSVAVTNASATVTLTGGTFPAAAASMVLDVAGVLYEVSTRDGDTQLTLADAYAGTTDSAADYSLHQRDYTLPDDFGGIVGPLTWASNGGSTLEIPIVGEAQVRRMRQNNARVGRPEFAAVRPIAGFDGTSGSRREMLLYPTPDDAYVCTYKKKLLVNKKLDSGNTYPIGGMAFGQLVLASCLAVAEKSLYRGQTAKQDEFVMQLAAAVSYDTQYAPDTLGLNLDRGRCDARRLRGFHEGQFTHNGNPTG